jgi:hypothetical protein
VRELGAEMAEKRESLTEISTVSLKWMVSRSASV